MFIQLHKQNIQDGPKSHEYVLNLTIYKGIKLKPQENTNQSEWAQLKKTDEIRGKESF